MTWFTPNISETSIIDQIEATYFDNYLDPIDRQCALESLWTQLENLHNCRVMVLRSPEGMDIHSPFDVCAA